uniref:Uncharacterized protein n=1 Tax=Anguilla anguilla TaxID=7936 RepID=A0A0E9V7B3_ANGAN
MGVLVINVLSLATLFYEHA